MSKDWKPDETVVRPLPAGKRLKSLDEFALPGFLGRMARAERKLPEGGKAGLMLVAAACAGVAIGAYLAFGPPEVVAPGAEAEWTTANEASNG